uniref:Uncharacterized protein n=2 Tax=Aplanochytrium stocchinoi TaxID=215587 RepID=A0A7S3PEL3_9STRA|mmetsp:Transcript_15567/g.17631  ORF Transcript_15567/g.17631 Transcript_15567/m.17631 type:complete len:284 (-) Transcript_15567:57-908(-)
MKDALDIENLLQYFHNINVDTCFINSAFLRDIKNTVEQACFLIEDLLRNFTIAQLDAQDFNISIYNYHQCHDLYKPTFPVLYDEVESLVADIEAKNYSAEQCNQEIISALISNYTVAPGAVPTNVLTTMLALGIFAQIFAKIIMVSFGKAIFRILDPLALHNGQIETIGRETAVPPAREIVKFLRVTHLKDLIISGLFFVACAGNLLYVSMAQIQETRDDPRTNYINSTSTVFIALGLTLIPLLVTALYVYCKRKAVYEKRVKLMVNAVERKYKHDPTYMNKF